MAENENKDKSAWALKPKGASDSSTPAKEKPVSRGNSWGPPAAATPPPAPAPQPEPEEEYEEYEEIEEETTEEEEQETAEPVATVPQAAPKLRVKRREATDVNAYNPVVERFPEKPPVDYSKYIKTAGKIIAGAIAALIVAAAGLAFYPLGTETESAAFAEALDHIDQLTSRLEQGQAADLSTMQQLQRLSSDINETRDNREAVAAIRAVYAMGQIQAGRINQGRPAANFVAQRYADTIFGDLCDLSGIVSGLEIDRTKAGHAYKDVLDAASTAIRNVHIRQAARQRLIDIQQKIRFWQ